METISLLKYDKPRILAIDFTQQSVQKIRQAGYNVRRAYTGVLKEDNNVFNMPCSISDVEIVVFYLRKETLNGLINREISPDSIEKDTHCLDLLLEDVWMRKGISIIFMEPDVKPTELNNLGIKFFGITNFNRKFLPASKLSNLVEELKRIGKDESKPYVLFPPYKGEDFHISDHPIAKIYKKHIHHGNHIMMYAGDNIEIFNVKFHEYPAKILYHVRENSSQQYPLCVEFTDAGAKHSIVILPTFGKKTDDVVIDLLDDYAKPSFEHLFSEPNFPWLIDYKSIPVQKIIQEKQLFIEQAIIKISEFDENIKLAQQEYEWMDKLLIGKDEPDIEPFKDAVKKSLNFLGFRVEDIDYLIQEGEPKREDLHVYNDESKYFALCELKTTDSGAKEQLFRDLQKHMMRYMRENKDTNLLGLLIVNHSIKLNPNKRHAFYIKQHVQEELEVYKISAIDSHFLHQICQKVLSEEISKRYARKIIESGKVVMSLND